jgi:hypothetical protein
MLNNSLLAGWRSQVWWSTKLQRWLLAEEKLGVHLLPLSRAHCEAAGLKYPVYNNLGGISSHEIANIAGNGMVVSAAARLKLIIVL